MVNAKFSNQMIEIIKSMVGNVFRSLECGNITNNEVYGNFQVNLDDFSIEFLNEAKEVPFYDSTEEISFFTCKKKVLNRKFYPYCEESVQKHLVNEKILSIYIVSDNISINEGEYEITFDMATVLETFQHTYIFSRGWFFGETITVSVDKDFDDIYPIRKVIEDWSDEGGNKVDVKRTVRRL